MIAQVCVKGIIILPDLVNFIFEDEDHVVVCYYSSWSQYRSGSGKFVIERIIPEMCTHLVYAFAGINLDGEIDSLDSNSDFANGKIYFMDL